MDANKAKFVYEVAKAVRLDAGEYTIEAISKMTAHIKPEQYSDFICKIAEGVEFARPLEIIKSVSDKYMDEIKSELFKDVEAEAKQLEKKIERYFYQIEEMFRPSSEFYDKEKAEAFKTPSELTKTAIIRTNDYWNDKDAYLINKIGLTAIYDVFNNPYKQVWELLAAEMKTAITKKYLVGSNKHVENKHKTVDSIKQLANKKAM